MVNMQGISAAVPHIGDTVAKATLAKRERLLWAARLTDPLLREVMER